MVKMYELETRFDGRQSFGHKAIVVETGIAEPVKTLFSYETPVAEIKGNKLRLIPAMKSMTTNRHITEFAKQNGVYSQLVELRKKK